MCLRLQENCQNYIRILVRTAPGKLLICGTSAFKPVCRDYSLQVSNI
jgi:semaphorin 6